MKVLLPITLLEQYRLYIEPEKLYIHILDLQVRKITIKQLRLLIQQIVISNEISDMSWNWVSSGDGKAFSIDSKSNIALEVQDSRLYHTYKEKMFLNIPFRKL